MLSATYIECHLRWVSLTLSVTYIECHLRWVSLTLSVTYAECYLRCVSFTIPFVLSVVMLNAALLSVIYKPFCAECRYAECCYADCLYAECLSTLKNSHQFIFTNLSRSSQESFDRKKFLFNCWIFVTNNLLENCKNGAANFVPTILKLLGPVS